MARAIFGSSITNRGWSNSFDSPLRTFTAYNLDQVAPLVKSAEAEAQAGLWVVLMLTYESAPAFDSALQTHCSDSLPLAWAAVFAGPCTTNTESVDGERQLKGWEPRITRAEYYKAVNRIRELIAAGDTYQVNYTFPLVTAFKGDPRGWYNQLCFAQGAEYCAYLDLGRYKVLSLSPELFFERQRNLLRTKPMKGTINRGRWAAEDQELAQTLAASTKDRAENVMIVDLLRNDLGKVSVPGSVQVSKLFEVERFETLWQMTSVVESTLRPGVSLAQIIAALFPCGSITGAPKIRTMKIIRELEPFPRGLYTGTIGFIRPGGDCVFNVAIRTIVLDSETGLATFGVGGGITAGSTPEHEYEECLVKSSFLTAPRHDFQLLESVLLEDGEFFLLDRHIERLRTSASYFGFDCREAEVFCELTRVAKTHSSGRWKIRLLLAKNGEIATEVIQLEVTDRGPLRVALAAKPVDSTNKFLFHKTTNRQIYDHALAEQPDCDDVILWNERGEITESSIANVVLPLSGELFTPPQASGLLAGTLRAKLLAEGKISERVIHAEELRKAQRFFLINSLRKWMEAILVD